MRVVIAEDMVLMRAGLARLLADRGFEVVGEADDADSLLRLVASNAVPNGERGFGNAPTESTVPTTTRPAK